MRILVAQPHPWLRDGLTHVLREIAPGAELVHPAKAELSRVPPSGAASFELAILAYPWVSLATLRALHRHAPAAVLVVITRDHDAATQQRLLDCGAIAIVPETAAPEIVAAALRVALCGDVSVQSAELRGHRAPASSQATHKPRTTDLNLTPRQFDVLQLVAGGRANKEIASELGIGLRTVKGHVAVLLRALRADNRRDAGRQARRWLARGHPTAA